LFTIDVSPDASKSARKHPHDNDNGDGNSFGNSTRAIELLSEHSVQAINDDDQKKPVSDVDDDHNGYLPPVEAVVILCSALLENSRYDGACIVAS
jgi:hypothetical protein